MQDTFKLRLGCSLLMLVFMGGPYLWFAIASNESGDAGSSTSGPASVREVDTLLHSKDQPEEALAACRTALAAATAAEEKSELDQRIPRCLAVIFAKKAAAKDWPGCEALWAEIEKEYPDAPAADTMRREWGWKREAWMKEAIAKDDRATADRLAAQMLADEKWRPVAADHPFFQVLARRWREAWDAGGAEAADAVFADVLVDERTGEHHAMLKEHELFLHKAIVAAGEAGRADEAERRFETLVGHARQRSARVSLRPLEPWLRGRMDEWAKKGDAAAAERFFEELIEVADSDDRKEKTGVLPALYGRMREAHWRKAAAAGDFAAAAKAFDDLGKHPYYVDRAAERVQRAAFLLLRWRAERDAGRKDDARAALLVAATDLADVADASALGAAMREEWTAQEMMANGDALLDKKDPEGALACFRAVGDWSGAGIAEAELAPRLDRAMLGSALRAAASAEKWVHFAGYERAEGLFRTLLFDRPSFRANAEEWRAAAGRLLAMQVKWADQASDNEDFPAAERAIGKAVRETAVAMWRAQAEADPEAAWKSLPAEVARRVEGGDAKADATARIAAACELAARGAWTVPQAEPARAMIETVRDRSAAAQADRALEDLNWASSREAALDVLRKVLRKYPRSKARERIKDGLEDRLHRVNSTVSFAAQTRDGLGTKQAAEDFETLSLYLGFYVAELGPLREGDPFRQFLEESLTQAADLAGRSNPLTRVFFLSLLADALPDDPAGRLARTEALAKGVEIMGQLPPHASPAATREMPSLVAGHSAQCIENQTPYHMLVFFKGEEEFYVRLDPFRRGVLVLKDGEYDNAVIVPREEVRPYHGKRTYAAVTRTEGYYIAREGTQSPADEHEIGEVTGDYRLLRAPESAGPVTVHPDTGLVFGGGK